MCDIAANGPTISYVDQLCFWPLLEGADFPFNTGSVITALSDVMAPITMSSPITRTLQLGDIDVNEVLRSANAASSLAITMTTANIFASEPRLVQPTPLRRMMGDDIQN